MTPSTLVNLGLTRHVGKFRSPNTPDIYALRSLLDSHLFSGRWRKADGIRPFHRINVTLVIHFGFLAFFSRVRGGPVYCVPAPSFSGGGLVGR